jgi:hypothetical protein
MGVVFSAGWTPCIGPVYGGILTLAWNGGDVGQAGGLLAAYSLGLGVPFLLTALALDRAQVVLRQLQRHMHKIELASGAFLIAIGVLVASGSLQSLSAQFAVGEFALAATNLENQVLTVITGQDQGGPVVVSPEDSDLVISNPQTNQASPRAQENSASVLDPEALIDTPPGLNGITELALSSSPSVGIS